MSAPPTWLGAFERARAAGTLTVRTKMFFPIERWRWVADTVANAGPGDDWLRIDGVKGYMDGSLGSTTALFFDPYLDAPGTRGLGTTDVDCMRRYVQAADSAQLQVAVHAIGDRANALLLDVYDSVSIANGARDRRFRIEHAQHLRPAGHHAHRDDERHSLDAAVPRHRRRALGRQADRQHAAPDDLRLPRPDRPGRAPRLRLRLDGGAARPAARHLRRGHPADPRRQEPRAAGFRPRRSRWTRRSGPTPPRTPTASSPRGAAACSAPGARADLVLLDRDLTTIPPTDIPNARVLVTVAGGRVVYRAPVMRRPVLVCLDDGRHAGGNSAARPVHRGGVVGCRLCRDPRHAARPRPHRHRQRPRPAAGSRAASSSPTARFPC